MSRRLLPLLLAPLLVLAGCSDDPSPLDDPDVAASAPVPGVTLPPGPLVDLVPTPEEVPAGMVPVVQGSGQRSLDDVAGYSGTGPAKAAAAAALTAHGFQDSYVAQYANISTGQVLTVTVSRFANATGATADFGDDRKRTTGTPVTTEQLGDESIAVTIPVPGSVAAEQLLLRWRRGADTWLLLYKAAPKADPQVGVAVAKALLGRTTT